MSNAMKPKHFVFLRRLPDKLMWGGLERVMMDWFERIDHSTCKVTLAVSPGGKGLFGGRFAIKDLPIEIVEIPFDLYEGSSKLFMDMYKLLNPLKPSSTIFIQGAFTDFRLAAVFAGFLLTGKNTFMHENLSSPLPTHKPGLKLRLQRLVNSLRGVIAQKIIVVSQEIKDQLVNVWGYPENKVAVSYHGINLNEFRLLPGKRQQVRRVLSIPMSDFVFIVPTRLAHVKRIERTIEAFGRLSKGHNNLWLIILGDGDLKENLQQLAAQTGNKDKILFLGHQDNIAEYLNAADCYVNSSDTEGLCIALLEAMACGAVCVATDCAGPTELIKNSRTGFLVNKSVDGVFQGMQKAMLLSQPDRELMVRAGIQFIKEYFEVNRLVKNLFNTIQISYAP